jgi:hypothetical protein
MSYIGNSPALKYASFAVQHFTTSATTSYSLSNSVANENELALFINNVRQQPGSSYAYTAAGTTLTLSAATTSSDTMYCVFIGKAVQTVVPPDGSVGTSQLADLGVTTAKLGALAVTNAKVADDAIGVDELSATGTASSSTFLRGDNSWTDPGGVALTGSTDNTVVTVTGADAIAGEANLQFDGTDLTVSTGNVIIGTAGKGIDFSAQTATSASGASTTSELLDHYEEGTWTPTIGGNATYHSQTGEYTRIGRYIYVNCSMQIAVIGTGSTTTVSGFPFSISGLGGSVNRFANLATNVINLMVTPATTSTNFCSVTTSAGVVTDTVAVFGSGQATQIQFFIVGKAA